MGYTTGTGVATALMSEILKSTQTNTGGSFNIKVSRLQGLRRKPCELVNSYSYSWSTLRNAMQWRGAEGKWDDLSPGFPIIIGWQSSVTTPRGVIVKCFCLVGNCICVTIANCFPNATNNHQQWPIISSLQLNVRINPRSRSEMGIGCNFNNLQFHNKTNTFHNSKSKDDCSLQYAWELGAERKWRGRVSSY